MIVTGRLIDKATGRVVPPPYVSYIKAPDNVQPRRRRLGFSRLADAAFGLTVPPGNALIAAAAAVSNKDDPYACARLNAADRGKGIGGFGDGESVSFPLSGSHTYRFVTSRQGASRSRWTSS